jgi:hypothetical protein
MNTKWKVVLISAGLIHVLGFYLAMHQCNSVMDVLGSRQ